MNFLRDLLMHYAGWILCLAVGWWVVARRLLRNFRSPASTQAIEQTSVVLTGLLILGYGTLIVFF